MGVIFNNTNSLKNLLGPEGTDIDVEFASERQQRQEIEEDFKKES